MNTRLLKIITFLLLVISVKQVYCIFPPSYDMLRSSQDKERSKVYIGLYLGVTSYFGDLNNNSLHIPFYRPYGTQILMEWNIHKSIRLSAGVFSGNIFGNERTSQRDLNFKTSLLVPQLGISYKIAQFYQQRYAVYFFAGAEMVFFTPSGDLKNTKGETYYYWDDGTVRNLPEIPANQNTASIIKPDLIYEADYRNLNFDNVSKYPRSAFAIPLGLSLEGNLNNGFYLRIGTVYHYTFTDYLDNITVNSLGNRKGNAAPDKFLFSYIGIIYNLPVAKAKGPSPNSCIYEKDQIDHKKAARQKLK